MADFSDEHKAESSFFQEGVHEVTIVHVEGGTNDNDKEYIEFHVQGENGEEGTARMWFTTDKAIKYTFGNIRGLFTKNALKGKEEAAKEMVNAVKNSEELIDLCNKVLVGKKGYYQVEKSDYTYTNAAGEEKQGYNRNLTGYEPKPKNTDLENVNKAIPGSEVVEDSEVPDGL